MKKSRDWSIWLLIVSGILVAILLNLGTFRWAINIITSDGFSSLDEKRGMPRLIFGGLVSLFYLILFLPMALFHYQWKDGLLNQPWPKAIKVASIVLISLVIYAVLVLLETHLFIENFSVLIKKKLPIDYFAWNNLPVAVIAITEAYFLILWRKVKASELEKAHLQKEKTNAELAALKEQISPHFFFNTLSSLSTIVRNEEKEVGLEFIQELSQTYRYTLASKRDELVSLDKELNFVKSYLFILHKRFGDKLICEVDIPEKYLKMEVPPMSVQLLVENATQHNIITRALPLTIKVCIDDEMLSVKNNLNKKSESEGLGLGLQNLTNRYQLIAGKDIVILKNENTFEVKLPLL